MRKYKIQKWNGVNWSDMTIAMPQRDADAKVSALNRSRKGAEKFRLIQT